MDGGKIAPVRSSQTDEAELIKSYYAKSSKMGNKECFCGSGQKFKKCCFLKSPTIDE